MSLFEDAHLFGYSPLDITKQEIRLLRIVKILNDRVECVLEHASGETLLRRPYYALSYCWGDQTRRKSISVNGKKLEVGPNLFEALKALHYYLSTEDDVPSWIWIDAICLDQQNDAEKATQVPRMDRIYQEAKRVLIWLGSEANGSAKVMSVLNCVQEYRFYQGFKSIKFRKVFKNVRNETIKCKLRLQSSLVRLEKDHGIKEENLEALLQLLESLQKGNASQSLQKAEVAKIRDRMSLKNHLFPQEDSFWPAFVNLVTRSWFSRLWTYQEILLADEEAVVLCGTKAVFWAVLRYSRFNLLRESCLDTLYTYKILETIQVDTDALYRSMNILDLSLRLFEEDTFQNLLLKIGSRYASDKRDYVYGLLGLIDKQQRNDIDIGYEKSPAEVFISAVAVACRLKGGPRLWCRLIENYSLTHQITEGLPTWCPDLASKAEDIRGSQFTPGLMVSQKAWQRGNAYGHVQFDQATRMMVLSGVRLDTIKFATTIAPSLSAYDIIQLAKHSKEGQNSLSKQDFFKLSFGTDQLRWLDSMDHLFTSNGDRKTALQLYWLRYYFFIDSNWADEELLGKFDTVRLICKRVITAGVKTIDEAIRELQIQGEEVVQVHEQIFDALSRLKNRYFFLTTSDRLGFSFRPTGLEDQVCLIPCAQLLFVLSPACDRFVTCAAVVGLMDDQAQEAFKNWTARRQTFYLK
ncbi:MAG: hypothetical protein Q9160_009213 [Pyrenula sp. 1 TL-2023]